MGASGQPAGAAPPVAWNHAPSAEHRRLLRARLWHAMTLPAFLRLMKGHAATIPLAKYPLLLSIAATASVNGAFAALEAPARKRARRRLRAGSRPVVVIGFWRSGTTMLHELLARDPQFVAPTTMQCFFPESFGAARALSFLIRPLVPGSRPMDAVRFGPGTPQEDEFAILNMGLPSPLRVFAFPSLFEAGPGAETIRPGGVDARWLERWSSFLSAVQAGEQAGRLLLKSSGHTFRIAGIRSLYPDAVFIHLARRPEEQIASAVKMFHTMAETQSLEADLPPLEVIAEFVLAMHERMYDAFFQARALLKESQLACLRYEDLVADPAGQVQGLYRQLGIEGYSRLEPALRDAGGGGRPHFVDRYTISAAFEAEVHRRTQRYRAAFGYE